MKHELGEIVKLFHAVPTGEEYPEFTKAFAALHRFYREMPDDPQAGMALSGSAAGSTSDFRDAKIAVLQALLSANVVERVYDGESAAKTALMVNAAFAALDTNEMGEVSDGYHTFNELYAHRVRLFSTLMSAHADQAWWSHQHHDGSKMEGWILAGIDTPNGPVTYHLPVSEIDMLPIGTELERGKEWDGHTADDVLERLKSL